jgi:hypothetical protein
MRRPFVRKFALLAVFLMAGTAVAWAHHGSHISYDMEKTITVQGTITELDFVNPHVYFLFDVAEKDGKVTSWAAESGPPSGLAARGWNRNTLKPGDKVVVTLWPSRLGTPRGFLSKVTMSNGKVLFEQQGQAPN